MNIIIKVSPDCPSIYKEIDMTHIELSDLFEVSISKTRFVLQSRLLHFDRN